MTSIRNVGVFVGCVAVIGHSIVIQMERAECGFVKCVAGKFEMRNQFNGLIAGILLSLTMSLAMAGIGFDPGMKIALAASYNPKNLQRYVESCPASPTGRCYGTIPAGGGFYTLPNDVDSEEYWKDTRSVFSDMFKWKRDTNGDLIAELVIDSRSYPSSCTPSFYTGLQLNIPIGDSYGGMSFSNSAWAVPSATIDRAQLEFRATVCPTKDDYFLTLPYYNDGWSVPDQSGYSLAFNYSFSWNTEKTPIIFSYPLISQGKFMRLYRVGTETDAQLYDTTFWIDAHKYGMLAMPPNNSAIYVGCNVDINKLPFKKVTFNVQNWLEVLETKKLIHSIKNYKYSGGIIAGVELWGRAKVVVQVKKHEMKAVGEPEIPEIPVGKFRMLDNSLWYSNGFEACQYINLQHAGVDSVESVKAIVPSIPSSWGLGWCPG